MRFTGFSEQTVDFEWNLRLNNSKEWFLAHKQEYETFLHGPVKDLAYDLQDAFSEAYPSHAWNVHISRIYRDARRLFGKGPMNDHLWFTLYSGAEKNSGAPAFWFAFSPEEYDCGMGCWPENSALMNAFRASVEKNPAPFEKLVLDFRKQDRFVRDGDPYKKPKYRAGELLTPWVNCRWFGLVRRAAHGPESFGPGLYDSLLRDYALLMPFYEYFMTLYHSVTAGQDAGAGIQAP